MNTQNSQKTSHKNPTHIKITKNNTYVSYGNGIEIPVSKALITQYVEYMLIANENVVIEIVP